jgi:hypothetical protein
VRHNLWTSDTTGSATRCNMQRSGQSLVDSSEDAADTHRFHVVRDLAKQLLSSKSEIADLRSQLELSRQEESSLRAEIDRLTGK